MDLGCLDMGCISILDKHNNDTLDSDKKESDSNDPRSSNSKSAKNKSPRGTNQSTLNALNKFTTQIKKPPHRKNSPINWFPRKKVDSYLKRKIKMLQEVDGMNLTLDETLGDTNPHYSRVLREKIAAREAAHKAMEARKAALVEASWCRILKAARIQCKEADALLLKSEKAAAEAFEAAAAMGVIMYDKPNCPQKHCEIETSSINGGRSTTHTVTASFETAFEVDKQVAAAVKTAFIRLAKCPSFSKDEFQDLLHKISENPETGDGQEISEFSLECESESGSELETVSQKDDGFGSHDLDFTMPVVGLRQKKFKRRQSLEKFNSTKLIDMMLERLKCLQEDELSSLATIVATCGLSAALAEVEIGKTHCPSSARDCSSTSFLARRMSSAGVGTVRNANLEYMDGSIRRKQTESELPSLDKFLVKHMSKLEREVQEAKNMRMNESKETTAENPGKIEEGKEGKSDNDTVQADTNTDLERVLVKKHSSKPPKEIQEAKKNSSNKFESLQKNSNSDTASSKAIPDLGSMLVKHTSKLQKEIEEAKRNSGKAYEMERMKGRILNEGASHRKEDVPEMPSLDKFLVKHVTRLEKEVQEARSRRNIESSSSVPQSEKNVNNGGLVGKENVDLNKGETTSSEVELKDMKRGIHQDTVDSLDKILVKPVHRLEREKMEAASIRNNYGNHRPQQRQGGNSNTSSSDSLDKVLIKHVSRLEKEKMRFNTSEEATMMVKRGGRNNNTHSQTNEEGGLDQVLVKHKSRLEREKMAAAASERPEVQTTRTSVSSRREARERELQEAWGGLSLGNSIRPHLSKLEKDKAAWIKAEEEERRQALQGGE